MALAISGTGHRPRCARNAPRGRPVCGGTGLRDRPRSGGHVAGRGRATGRHGAPGTTRRGGPLQRRRGDRAERPPRIRPSHPDAGAAGNVAGADPAWSRPGLQRHIELDPRRTATPRPKWRASEKVLPAALAEAARAHPAKQIALYVQDEARLDQKGRACHRCWLRGPRRPGLSISATTSPMCPQPSRRPPERRSAWCCPRSRPPRCTASWPKSRPLWQPTRRSSWCSTALVGTPATPSSCRKTSRCCGCRPPHPS